jgi:branched-chain amino acid aminotransferase
MASASAQLPEGAYTTFRTYGGNGVVRLDQHLRRLEQSVALKGTPGLIEAAAARAALGEALRAARHAESRVRLTFAPPRLFVALEAFTPLDPALYERGAAAVTLDMQRDNPLAKDTRFIATAREAYSRLPPGVEEGLLVAEDGTLLEGLSSNFFAVVDGELRTEQDRVLEGITRSLAIDAARPVLPLRRLGVRRAELPRVQEAFLTSVSRELLPVVRIDERAVGDGRVGPTTRAVMQAFAALVAREREEL